MTEAEAILKEAVDWYHSQGMATQPSWAAKAGELLFTRPDTKVAVNKDDLQKWLDRIKIDRTFREEVTQDVQVIKAMFTAITQHIDLGSPMKAVAAITKMIAKPDKAKEIFDFEKLTDILNKYK